MLIACPNCGNPVCSDCGSHVSPGAVGAPTFKRAIAPIQQAGFTKFPNFTWDSKVRDTNRTYYDVFVDSLLQHGCDSKVAMALRTRWIYPNAAIDAFNTYGYLTVIGADIVPFLPITFPPTVPFGYAPFWKWLCATL